MIKYVHYLSLFCSLFLPSLAYASEIYLILHLEGSHKTNIHKNIVTKTGLHKKKADDYHVTLAGVQNVDAKDKDALKKYLRKRLKERYPNYVISQYKKKGQFAMSVGLKKADRYLVGKRTLNKCPLVFYFLPGHNDLLVQMNAYLSACLPAFKGPSGNTYTKFAPDLRPGTYIPHMTIADTKYIDGQKADRDDVIEKLNRNLDKASQGMPDDEYRFKLRV